MESGFLAHWPGEPEAINADSFAEDVLEASVPVLVEFWAARCAACARLAPVLGALARAQAGDIRVFTVNVDEEPEAAARCDVRAVPSVLCFVGGRETGRRVGAVSRADLVDLLRTAGTPAPGERPCPR